MPFCIEITAIPVPLYLVIRITFWLSFRAFGACEKQKMLRLHAKFA
jgi:hypothetical protein